MRLLEFWEFLKILVRDLYANREIVGIGKFLGILSFSNLSVFSVYDGFDSRRLHHFKTSVTEQLTKAPSGVSD